MDIKINEPTQNRPEGKRLLDAPAVFIDFTEQGNKLLDEVAWEKSDRNSITVFKSGGTTAVITALHKDAILEDLEIDGLLMVQVLEGALCMTDDSEGARIITAKQMMVIHPGRKVRVTAEQESVVLLTIIREVGDVF